MVSVSLYSCLVTQRTAYKQQLNQNILSLCLTPLGDVFCIIRIADAHEHAAGVSLHCDGGSGRAAVQLLPPLVWRHLPGQRPVQHPLPLSRPQAGTREKHDPLIPCISDSWPLRWLWIWNLGICFFFSLLNIQDIIIWTACSWIRNGWWLSASDGGLLEHMGNNFEVDSPEFKYVQNNHYS